MESHSGVHPSPVFNPKKDALPTPKNPALVEIHCSISKRRRQALST